MTSLSLFESYSSEHCAHCGDETHFRCFGCNPMVYVCRDCAQLHASRLHLPPKSPPLVSEVRESFSVESEELVGVP